MKSRLNCSSMVLTLLVLATHNSTCFAQGSLTPPGAPGPTMKSLDQIEPRTAITNKTTLVTISQPGSYYLTHNLTVNSGDAIHINTNGVTLDLNGFTISSTANPASGTGILLSGVQDVTILNGHIRGSVIYISYSFTTGPGFHNGISYTVANPVNVRVSGISVAGCDQSGVDLGYEYSDVVDHCTIRTVGGQGIHAGIASDSTAYQCGDNALNVVTASGCYGVTVAGARGIYSYTAINCYGVSVSGNGVDALSVKSCFGTSTSGKGINANSASDCTGISDTSTGVSAATALNCSGSSSSGYGIFTYMAMNCNGFSSSGYGIYANPTALCCSAYAETGTALHAYIADDCDGYANAVGGTSLEVIHSVNTYSH